MPVRFLIFSIIAAAIIGAVSIFSDINANTHIDTNKMYIGDKEISLIKVSNSESRAKGLGGMQSLPSDQAMLFSFDEPDQYGIWMKDMNFPIDIIWLDEKHRIVDIKNNISPNTYPEVFTPKEKSLFIIETNEGFAVDNNLKVGNILNFTSK